MSGNADLHRKRGRPRRDPAQLVAEVAAARAAFPDASGSALALRVHARKANVLRAVSMLKEAERRFQYSRSDGLGGRPDGHGEEGAS